jgi:hypothetical protein
MDLLSLTVTSLSINFSYSEDDALYALGILQDQFPLVTSVQLLYLDKEAAALALSNRWRCLNRLSKLVIFQSMLPFAYVSNFVYLATCIQSLTIEDCYPLDAAHGSVTLKLPSDRDFHQIDVQASYAGLWGPKPVLVKMTS